MPDLTPVAMQMCKSNERHCETAGRYKVWTGDERHEPTCKCPAFRFARRDSRGEKRCKHIDEVEERTCGWHAQWSVDTAQSDEQREQMACPKCGGPTVGVTVMA